MTRHRETHVTLKSFKCKFCERRFKFQHSNDEHEKLHEGPMEKRPLVCEYCQKTFKCNSTLVEHIRLHTGERPFGCICGRTYVSKSALSKHRAKCALVSSMETSWNPESHAAAPFEYP